MTDKPICTWVFDSEGNLTICVPAAQVVNFGNWISDEYGDSEPEMYQLMNEIDARGVLAEKSSMMRNPK